MNTLELQLEQYAQDFQELARRHSALDLRHENLKASHARFVAAREVLASQTSTFNAPCLAIDQRGEILLATNSARAMFMRNGDLAPQIQNIVAPFHLTHLETMLRNMATNCIELLSDSTEFFLCKGGDLTCACLFSVHFICLPAGDSTVMYWIMRDLTSQAPSDSDTDRMANLVKNLHQGAAVLGLDGEILAIDAYFMGLTGFGIADVTRSTHSILQSATGQPVFTSELYAELKSTGSWRGSVTTSTEKGRPLHQWMTVSAVSDRSLLTVAYVAVFSDRANMRKAERFILANVDHDPETGLPNPELFHALVSNKIASAWRGGLRVTVLSIALDRLKWLRETEDSSVSQALLLIASERLQVATRGCDKIAQSGDGHFLALLTGVRNGTELGAITERIVRALSEPYVAGKQKLLTSCSIGCAMFPQDGVDAADLISHAESAMKRVQKDGGGRFLRYDPPDIAGEST